MNNNNDMTGKPNKNGYRGNSEGNVRRKTKSRTYKASKPVKGAKPALALAPTSTNTTGAIRKMMGLLNQIKREYPDIILSSEVESQFRHIAKASVLANKSTELGQLIRSTFGNHASSVRPLFREAGFLREIAKSRTVKKPKIKSTNTSNPYAGPVKGTKVGAVTAKLRAARELDIVIKTTGATKAQVDAAVKNIAASGMPEENRLEALKARLIAEHKERLLLNTLGHTLSAVPVGKKQANWRMLNAHAAALAEAPAPAPYTGFYMKPATFIAPGGIGAPRLNYTAPVVPPPRASSDNEDGWGGEGNNDNSLETAMAALAGLGI